MITTEQLYVWQKQISTTLENALNLASKFSGDKDMRTYYTHLAKTADAQLALIQRLGMQSVANDQAAHAIGLFTGVKK